MFALDRTAGSAGDLSEAGIRGEVPRGGEGAGVANLDQDAGCGRRPLLLAWRSGVGQEGGIKGFLHLGGDRRPLIEQPGQS